jgi:Fungal specific transcription factor domain/Fungal Zn(2)-Cys(6) binuclear cluster domain
LRFRQKCDEKKPQCGRCSEAGAECEYSVRLRWGGRAFDRSRFGNCLKGSVRKTTDSPDGFVYAASEAPLTVPQELPVFPTLSTAETGLLYHYTEEASRITCCSAHVQKELCQLVLPMAVESPALMNATLAWAAMHSVEFRGQIKGVSDPIRLIATLKARSIAYLRRELQKPDMEHGDALLATVRTLCQCEIHSGSDRSSAWRIHVKGATALMNFIERSQRRNGSRLLYRWYAAMDSLAMLASCGTTAMIEVEDRSQGFCERSEDIPAYLDDYNGYSTDLSSVIGEIGSATAPLRQGGSSLSEQADALERAIFTIMERDNNSEPIFYPGVVEKLTPQAIQEYSLCNQAYQHTALIYVRWQLRGLPRDAPEIQDSVKRIIKCVSSITPSYGLSPAIVLTTPLFTAGCEALGEDREVIRRLLSQLYERLRIRNIKLALEVLDAFWADENINGYLGMLLRTHHITFAFVFELSHYYRPKELEFHSLLRDLWNMPSLFQTQLVQHQSNERLPVDQRLLHLLRVNMVCKSQVHWSSLPQSIFLQKKIRRKYSEGTDDGLSRECPSVSCILRVSWVKNGGKAAAERTGCFNPIIDEPGIYKC